MSDWRFDILRGDAARPVMERVARTAFQRPAWVDAVAEARGRAHQPVVVRAIGADGRCLWLPGGVHRRAGLPVFEAAPMAGYGGWCADDPGAAVPQQALTQAWWPHCPWPAVLLTSPPGHAAPLGRLRGDAAPQHFETHVLHLGTDEVMLRAMQPRFRSYLRKSAGIADRFILNPPGAVDTFFAWYREGSAQWKQTAHATLPPGFFHALAADALTDVWIVEREGRTVGAAMFLRGAGEVQYQASGVARLDGPLSVMESLLWHLARHYRDAGLDRINLGASTGLDSVRRFKDKFGAQCLTYARSRHLMPALLGRWPFRLAEAG